MNTTKKTGIVVGAAAALLSGLAVIAGCQSDATEAKNSSPTTKPSLFAQMMAPATQKSGAELWADNCSRCHNIRPPDYYSDAQWGIIVHHMRLRADLTGQEAKSIEEFLKTAN